MSQAVVLVVDQDEAHATVVRDYVVQCGHEAVIALDANEALFRLAQRAYELVITDVQLAGDNLEFIERIRENDPMLAIIATTPTGKGEGGVRALRAGAGAYLSKPLDQTQLRAKMEQLLERRASRLSIERLRRSVDEHLLRRK